MTKLLQSLHSVGEVWVLKAAGVGNQEVVEAYVSSHKRLQNHPMISHVP